MIHFGHGAEFNVPGHAAQGSHFLCNKKVVAEHVRLIGLAWAAVHSPDLDILMPKEFFHPNDGGMMSGISSLMATLPLRSRVAPEDLHSFSIVAQMLKDADLKPSPDLVLEESEDDTDNIRGFLDKKGHLIRKYASKWQVNAIVPGEVTSKMEELSWLAVLIYGVGGWNAKRDFRADFFT